MIDGQRPHESIESVCSVVVDLFLNRSRCDGSAGDIDLRPLRSGRSRVRSGPSSMLNPERFNASNTSILVLHHRSLGQGVAIISRSRLRNRRRGAGINRLRHICWTREGGVRRCAVVDVELEDVPSKQNDRFTHNVIGRTGRRSCPPIVAGQQRKAVGPSIHYYASKCGPAHQIIDIECPEAHFLKRGASTPGGEAIKHVCAHV
jgi:hypothetical protein